MNQFYKSYGIKTTDPAAGLIAGAAAQQKSLSDVVKGIEGMMKNQEGQIIQRNTQQATDMFKQQIAQKGLGILSEPIDQESALRQFGNMVNKEAVGKAITEQTDLLKNTELSNGNNIGIDIFSKTKSLGDARKGVEQYLTSKGAPSSLATSLSNEWATSNANLPKEYTEFKTKLGSDTSANILNDVASGAHKDYETALKNRLTNVPVELQPEIVEKANADWELRTKPSTQRLEEFATIDKLTTSKLAIKSKAIEDRVAQAKAAAEAAPSGASDASKLQAKSLAASGTLDSLVAHIATDAKNGWFKGAVRAVTTGADDDAGYQAAIAVQRGVQRLMDQGLSQEDATAIGLKAYQDHIIIDSAGAAGKGISDSGVNNTMDKYAEIEMNKRTLTNAADEMQRAGEIEALQNAEQTLSEVQAIKNESRVAKLKGQSYSALDSYKKLVGASTANPLTNATPATGAGDVGTPGSPEAKKATINKFLPPEKPPVPKPKGKITIVPASPDTSVSTAAAGDSKKVLLAKDAPQKLLPDGLLNFFKDPQGYMDRMAAPDVAKLGKRLNGVSSAEASTGSSDKLKTATDIRRGIIDGVNIGIPGTKGAYATSEAHLKRLNNIHVKIPIINNEQDAQKYITKGYPTSNVTGAMAVTSAKKYGVPIRLLLAAMEQDSSFSTKGKGQRTKNPGNVGNNDAGDLVYYEALRDGVDAVAKNLSKRKVKRGN